jgi:hypothetical protein
MSISMNRSSGPSGRQGGKRRLVKRVDFNPAGRMEGTLRENRVYYRCPARSIVPGAPVLATHPKNVNLPESAVVGPINEWIGSLFGPERREGTVRRLLSADANSQDSARGAAAAKAVADAERRLAAAAVGDRGRSRPGGTGAADQPRTGTMRLSDWCRRDCGQPGRRWS